MDEVFLIHGPDQIMLYLQPAIPGALGDDKRAAQVINLSELAYSAKEQGDLESALRHETTAYELCLELRDTLEEAAFHSLAAAKLYNMGQLYCQREEFERARSCFEQARELDAVAGNLVGQAASIRSLGFLQQDAGDPPGALELHTAALELDSKAGFEYGITIDKANIGAIYLELRDFQRALRYLKEALTSFEALGKVQEARQIRQLMQTVNHN